MSRAHKRDARGASRDGSADGVRPRRVRALILCCVLLAVLLFAPGPTWAFEFHGFSHVNLLLVRDSDSSDDTEAALGAERVDAADRGSFALGGFDLFANHEIDERASFLGEVQLETDGSGEAVLDIERLQVTYAWSDAWKAGVGRVHNPIGYWNTTFHHGLALATSVDRPDYLEFEDDGGILPIHAVGFFVEGVRTIGSTRFEYQALLYNGSRFEGEGSSPNAGGDDSNEKALTVDLRIRPNALPLVVGVSAATTRYRRATADGSDIDQTIAAGYARCVPGEYEFLLESYFLFDRDRDADTSALSVAWHVQASRLYGGCVEPYLRFERLAPESGDVYLAALGSEGKNVSIEGLRFHLGALDFVKLEARQRESAHGESEHELRAQWAFGF